MKKDIISFCLALIATTILTAQEVNYKRVENAHIIDISTGDTLSSHSSDIEAAQQLYNNQAQGKSVRMSAAIYELDITGLNTPPTPPVVPEDNEPFWDEFKAIDTVEVLAFKYGNINTPRRAVLNYFFDIMVAEKDSSQVVPPYVFTAKLERTQSWPDATTKYKLARIVFQFHKSDSVWRGDGWTKIRTFATKKHCINHYVNGVKIPGDDKFGSRACGPGNSTYAGGSFRHTNTFDNLDYSINNVIKLEALDLESGQVIGSQSFVIPKE